MYTDSIADMLTRIRNAARAKKLDAVVPHSKLKESLARLLLAEGFVSGVQVVGTSRKLIQVTIKYKDGDSVISDLKRVSSPGQRMYLPVDKLPRASSGFGITVVSTSKGLMTDKQARKANMGGEVICQVW
jgi:small subunit ribosomal protein S8